MSVGAGSLKKKVPAPSTGGRTVRRQPRGMDAAAEVLRGEARFAGDLEQSGALSLVVVSSSIACAHIALLDVDAARAMPGVAAVFVADVFFFKQKTAYEV